MIIVTGAAGFIGSAIVARLNEIGNKDLILVDHMHSPDDPKHKNIDGKKYSQYFDKSAFIEIIRNDEIAQDIDCLIHMGACSSTTGTDQDYYRENNYEYTKTLALWCLKHNVRYIYASSAATYGDGSVGYKDDDDTVRNCKPLNLYGQSKQDFDLWVLDQGHQDQMVGLKFFNVFGPNEYHKGDMRSVVAKAYKKVAEEGMMCLFKSYHPDYADGEQKRDFIYVKDAVAVVMFFVEHSEINGIFNVGTGQARSWNDLAKALFKAVSREENIQYIEMPEHLKEKYQYFTQADMSKLIAAGFDRKFTSLENAITDYVNYLKDNTYL